VSESGWRAFLAASGIEEWVVLHGGPTAVYRTSSLAEAAALAQAIAAVPGLDGTHAQINLLSSQVTVRLTRDQLIIEQSHIELARAVSVVAKGRGAVADRSAVNEVQVAISAKPDAIDLGFWRAVLGYAPMQSDNAIDPLGNSSTVWMQELDEAKPLRHAMHIDVSVPREQAEGRFAAAVAAGGVIVDASHAPSYWILADRSGNKVCIAAWPDGAAAPSEANAD
jgi:4a-hydroxytetrahydrobiopterin dehydratase